ncbi:MAG: FkbM family methyltransferase [Selenomonadaceae bacterium]|nr:FkbM family methyltransferase [Selenomonadaceae bacterium]
MLGAAHNAKRFSNELSRFGVEVDGYAVDEKYFQPNKKFLGKPVYNFEELSKQHDKYVFVLGTTDEERAIKFFKDKKIIRYVLTWELATIDYEYISARRYEFADTFEILSDDLSRQTMIAYLKAKITGNPSYNFPVYDPNQYFNELTSTLNGGGYVDCGAYNGDTVEKFINWSGGNYTKVFAIEADKNNFDALEKFVREKNYRDVSTLNCGVWNERTKITFSSDNETSSSVSDEGNVTIDAEKIDDIVGDTKIGFIKMDIEGSELNALRGATETIKRDKPMLAICAYHKAEDLITIPQFIKSLHADYKLYLRKHTCIAETELVLYAIS